MAEEMKGPHCRREGKTAEIDGGYFGGNVKPPIGKKNALIAASLKIRTASARSLSSSESAAGTRFRPVFHSESQASAFIRARIAKGTVVHADEVGSWDNLHERFEVKRINHQEAYSLDGACTNWAQEYFSRLRRAEVGIHHHIAGA